jgi:anti-sigma-K factor RskA
MTDDELEALLRGAPIDATADDGFTERVMQRVKAEARLLDANAALAELGARAATGRRATRWRWTGAAAGAVVAAAPIVASGLPSALQTPQLLALIVAAAASAWALAAPTLREDA